MQRAASGPEGETSPLEAGENVEANMTKMTGKLRKLSAGIEASYRSDTRTQRIGAAFLPGRDAIVEIIAQLRQLLFPGFFGQLSLTAENTRYHVGVLLDRLGPELAGQIHHCL